jgi:NADH:ubiquinone oxidoreductase subunit 4 (subunit M)
MAPMAYARFPFLSLLLLCCIGGLLAILCTPAAHTRRIKWISAVFSGLSLLISAGLFIAYDKSIGGFQFVENNTTGCRLWGSATSTPWTASAYPCCC